MGDVTAQVSSSISALMREFDIIAHNLANVSTAGYKRRTSAFSQSLATQIAAGDTEVGSEIDTSEVLDFSQGNLVQTGRPLDVALFGKGFFVVETTEGPLYTRNGVFRTNQNGQIVDFAGRIVAGQAGPIVVPPTVGLAEVSISTDGTVFAGGTGVGRFQLADFQDDQDKLIPVGGNCYRMVEDVDPVVPTDIDVRQGCHEASNVKIVKELVNMITVSRLYEANMKMVTARKESSASLMDVAMG